MPTERQTIQRPERHLPVAFEAAGRKGRGVTANLSTGGLRLKSATLLGAGEDTVARARAPARYMHAFGSVGS